MKKATDKELSVLEKHEVKTDWREKAEWRRENRRWLRYSGFIALMVMNRLDELKLSQRELAEKMSCSPQYVSKLLKGSENLTLDTISKLEECLDLDLVRSALTHVDGYEYHKRQYGYVAEPDPPHYGNKKE
jgi:ribosome-binding protein aMBF1 (putative translation factor)